MIVDNFLYTKPIQLNDFGGGKVICTELVQATVRINNQTIHADFCVVDENVITSSVLLGTDVLCTNGNRIIIEEGMCRVEPIESDHCLNVTDNADLDGLLQEFSDCFAKRTSELGKCNNTEM